MLNQSSYTVQYHVQQKVPARRSASSVAARYPALTECAQETKAPARPAHEAVNGYAKIVESCKQDFFTIRADCVQDAVLATVDSLAEYLVWDGMDRRLRAAASAHHTASPEATVSIQQIAADIKSRLGHELCERTVERAIKKLSVAGLIAVESRFAAGRRQASAYRLLFSSGMEYRLQSSRRGKKAPYAPKSAPQPLTPESAPVHTHASYAQLNRSSSTTEDPQAFARDNTSSSFGVRKLVDVANNPLPAGLQRVEDIEEYRVHICTQGETPRQSGEMPPLQEENPVMTEHGSSAGTEEPGEKVKSWENGDVRPETERTGVGHYTKSTAYDHPTPVSPLFNNEKEKNKKVIKNVYCLADFVKKDAEQTNDNGHGNGYHLDPVHQKGWVRSRNPQLQRHFGVLSRHLFLSGTRDLESLVAWFETRESQLQSGAITLKDILQEAGEATEAPEASVGTHRSDEKVKPGKTLLGYGC